MTKNVLRRPSKFSVRCKSAYTFRLIFVSLLVCWHVSFCHLSKGFSDIYVDNWAFQSSHKKVIVRNNDNCFVPLHFGEYLKRCCVTVVRRFPLVQNVGNSASEIGWNGIFREGKSEVVAYLTRLVNFPKIRKMDNFCIISLTFFGHK